MTTPARKAMLLAAGRGERLRPLSDHTPKPLVEVAGVPLIEHHLRKLSSVGVRQVVVNHAHLGEQIEKRLGDGKRFGLAIEYSPEPGGALETAGGIVQALPQLTEHCDSFLVINADVYCEYDFARLLAHELDAEGEPPRQAHLVMVQTPSFKKQGDFKLARDGSLSEKGRGKELTYSGIALMSAALFEGIRPGRAPLRPLLAAAMAQGLVSGEYFAGDWEDVGTLARLDALNARLHARSVSQSRGQQ